MTRARPGDVVGKGAQAAAAMGQLRSAVRAFAMEGLGPAELLARLSRFAETVAEAACATVAYAVLDPGDGEVRYACAGHPYPLLLTAGGSARLLRDGRGGPLAGWSSAGYAEGRARLSAGDAWSAPGAPTASSLRRAARGHGRRRRRRRHRPAGRPEDAAGVAGEPGAVAGAVASAPRRLAPGRRAGEDLRMAIHAVGAGRARWAALAAFALATLSVIGRERHTPLPPARPPAPARPRPRPSATAPPAVTRPAPAPVAASELRGGPRGLSCAALSLVLPGAGQVHGGARARGAAMLGVVVALLIAALALARQDVVFLVGQALRPEVLLGALALNGAVLLFRAGAVADAWRLGTRPARRATRAALLAALLAVVAVPHVLAAWYQWSAYDAVTTIFADVDPADIPPGLPFRGIDDTRADRVQALEAQARAEAAAKAAAAWPPGGRLTVLLLGGDAGPGRSGLRTDTMVVATIHERTRRAALLSLPRNMGERPAAARRRGPGAGRALPRHPQRPLRLGRALHADRFPGRDPGATALKQVAANLTGLRVNYYALVDFRGFVEMVDALGGVTVTCPRPVLDRVSPPEDGQDWIRIDLPAGPPEACRARGLRLRPRPQLQLRLRPHPAPALRDGGARAAGRPGPGAAVVPAPRPGGAAEREHRHPAPRAAAARGAGGRHRPAQGRLAGVRAAGVLGRLGRRRLPGAGHPRHPGRDQEGDRPGRGPRRHHPRRGGLHLSGPAAPRELRPPGPAPPRGA